MKSFVSRNYRRLLLILIVVGIGFFAYGQIQAGKIDKSTVFDQNKDKIVSVTREDIRREITLSGEINASEHTHLAFQTSGLVSWVGVKEGDIVKKNQAIASLDKRALKKTFERYLNLYMSNRWDFEQTQDNYKDEREHKLITDEIQRIIDKTQFSLNNTVLDLELQDLTVRLATITTPIGGIVLKANPPFAGVNVVGYQADYEIVNPNTVYLTSKIDEEDVNNIHLDQNARLLLDNFPDLPLDTTIIYIGFQPISGESSTVYEVRFAINQDNSNLIYRLGMNGDAKITTASADDILVLPLDAINDEDNQKYVLVKTQTEKLERKNVTTGIESVDNVEITNGLNENDQVVIKL